MYIDISPWVSHNVYVTVTVNLAVTVGDCIQDEPKNVFHCTVAIMPVQTRIVKKLRIIIQKQKFSESILVQYIVSTSMYHWLEWDKRTLPLS